MHFTRSSALAILAFFAVNVLADTNSTCLAFGIDFKDGESYFINSASTDNFTIVTSFEGCNADNADVWFVPPSGDELDCSTIPTLPSDTNEISTWSVLVSNYRTL